MQLHQMRYVLEAAKKKSFSAAAKSLYLSQPSLSQQILHLEKELGIALFVRHSKSVSLTEAGEQFVASAERILNEVDRLKENMEKFSLLEAGTLRIGILWIAGYLQIPRVITDYHSAFPRIRYQLHVEGSNTLFSSFLRLFSSMCSVSMEKPQRNCPGRRCSPSQARMSLVRASGMESASSDFFTLLSDTVSGR